MGLGGAVDALRDELVCQGSQICFLVKACKGISYELLVPGSVKVVDVDWCRQA